MGTWVHRLSSVDDSTRSGICSTCGPVSLISSGKNTQGKTLWRCQPAKHREKRVKLRPWILHKKSVCFRCGFVPEDPCQLDVDHIDGNNSNNDPSNYQTLCANCHRLKTQQNKDWETKVFLVNPLETP
jgi:hypothetical protein